jgi:excisionase family DNA binding protein
MTILRPEKPLTTFQVARLCGVFHTTVINWVNKGKLKAHHTPGGHRRIELDDLITFLRQHGSPVPPELTNFTRRIVLVEEDASAQKAVLRALKGLPDSEVKAYSSPVEALIEIGKEPPDLVVMSGNAAQVDPAAMCRAVQVSARMRPVKVISFAREGLPREREQNLSECADHHFRKFTPDAIQAKAAQLLSLKLK